MEYCNHPCSSNCIFGVFWTPKIIAILGVQKTPKMRFYEQVWFVWWLNFLRMLLNDFGASAFKTRFRCSGSPMQKRLIGMSQACLTYHRSTPVWFIWTLWHFEKIRFLHFFPWKKIRSFLAKLFFKTWSIKKANSVVVFSSWLSLWILGLTLRENVRWISWVSYFSKKKFHGTQKLLLA